MSADVFVLGVGLTRFTKAPERTIEDLGREAVLAAIRDADIARSDIDAAVCGSLQGGAGLGQRALKDLGLTGIPILNVENACASGSSAFWDAVNWVRAGVADVVLALGAESLSVTQQGLVDVGALDYASQGGLVLPAAYALMAKRHMDLHGTTREQFARVAVKSHANAMANPLAHFHKPVTIDEVLASPMISDPITLYQCCPSVDGAGAAIVASAASARMLGGGTVRVVANAIRSGRLNNRADIPMDLVERTAPVAYEMAGLGPGDIDVAEVHDAFSPGELVAYEELGFCDVGGGGEYIERGRSAIGGDGVAVNPSGGILSRGHPFGATGFAQIAELTWQLRGQAGRRQVERARVGLAHTMGGTVFDIEASACAIHILTV